MPGADALLLAGETYPYCHTIFYSIDIHIDQLDLAAIAKPREALAWPRKHGQQEPFLAHAYKVRSNSVFASKKNSATVKWFYNLAAYVASI